LKVIGIDRLFPGNNKKVNVCPSDNSQGIGLAITYQVLDASGAALQQSGLVPKENVGFTTITTDNQDGTTEEVTRAGRDGDIGPGRIPRNTGRTDADGKFVDAPFTICAPTSNPIIRATVTQNLNGTPNEYDIDKMFTNERNKMTITYNPLNFRDKAGNPQPTFANFHIHPKGRDGNSGAPSTPEDNSENNGRGDTGAYDDIYNDKSGVNPPNTNQAIQVYVMSWQGLSMYDPATRTTTQLVQGIGFLTGKGCPK